KGKGMAYLYTTTLHHPRPGDPSSYLVGLESAQLSHRLLRVRRIPRHPGIHPVPGTQRLQAMGEAGLVAALVAPAVRVGGFEVPARRRAPVVNGAPGPLPDRGIQSLATGTVLGVRAPHAAVEIRQIPRELHRHSVRSLVAGLAPIEGNAEEAA